MSFKCLYNIFYYNSNNYYKLYNNLFDKYKALRIYTMINKVT